MIFDTHLHTEFSFDSEMKLTEALQSAQNQGIGIILTEHMDLHYAEEGNFAFDEEAYFSAYRHYQSDSCLLGIELGMQDFCAAENQKIIDAHPFDFVLGSVHLVEGKDLYYASFYENRTKEETYAAYFNAILDCVRLHPFIDALGHIDYIVRYARYPKPEISYAAFAELIDPILSAIINQGTVMELNTRRMGDDAAVQALLPIYRRYAELGGRAVTLGSDAHQAKAIGANFADAIALAEACDLRPVYFKNRKMEYMIAK